MKNKVGIMGCALLLTFGTFTSCGSITGKEDTPILLADRKVEFITEPAIKMDIEEKFEVDGTIYSSKIHRLSFGKSGKLSFFNAYVGKEVKKGEILATIDISDIEHKIVISELKVEQDELRLVLAERTGNDYKIKEAEIELEIQNLELAKLKEYLEGSTLISEVDGIISTFTSKALGSIVNQNYNLISVMDVSELGIKFGLNEHITKQIKIGDFVDLSIDNVIYSSEIINIVDNQVYAEVPEEIINDLKITYKIKVSKVLSSVEGAILVPKVGIYTSLDDVSTVQILDGDKLIIKEIILGIELDEYFQVMEGINEGDQIIVK